MSDQRAKAGQVAATAPYATNEPSDQGRLLSAVCLVGFVFAVGIGLIWGQWWPLLVLICSLAVVWMAATYSPSQARSAADASASRSGSSANGSRDFDLRMIGTVFAACLAGVTLIAIAARWADPFRWLLSLCLFGFLVASPCATMKSESYEAVMAQMAKRVFFVGGKVQGDCVVRGA